MKRLLFVLSLAALAGCNYNLVDPSAQSSLAKTTPVYTGTFPKPWILYEDALNTGGGIQTYGDYWRLTTIDFANATLPALGAKCIKLTFDPNAPGPPPSAWWCDFQLIHATDYTKFAADPGIDLSAAAYTTCSFYARMTCTASVLFAAQTVNSTKTVTAAWQQFSISLPPPASQTAVKVYFRAEQPSPISSALDLYIDQISFQ